MAPNTQVTGLEVRVPAQCAFVNLHNGTQGPYPKALGRYISYSISVLVTGLRSQSLDDCQPRPIRSSSDIHIPPFVF